MGVEEQKEEREVLDSIFPDEITDVSDTSYRITIALDVPPDPNDGDEPTEPPSIVLNVTYPDKYPDVGPYLDISSPPNATKYPLLDVAEDKAELLELLQPSIEESLGMAMVFTLVTTLKELAETLVTGRQQKAEQSRELEARKKEEEENRRFHGTMVTRDRFLEWRSKFRKEMEEKEKARKEEEEIGLAKKAGAGPRVDEKKMTGRQLWERGLAGKADQDMEDGAVEQPDEAARGIEKLKVDG